MKGTIKRSQQPWQLSISHKQAHTSLVPLSIIFVIWFVISKKKGQEFFCLDTKLKERFHMTPGCPYWCSKTMKRLPTEAMLVFQANPVGVELFSYVNAFLRSNKFA